MVIPQQSATFQHKHYLFASPPPVPFLPCLTSILPTDTPQYYSLAPITSPSAHHCELPIKKLLLQPTTYFPLKLFDKFINTSIKKAIPYFPVKLLH